MNVRRRASRRSMLGGFAAVAGLAGSGVAARLGVLSGDGDAADSIRTARTAGFTPPGPTLFLDRYTTLNDGGRIQRKHGDQSLLRGTLVSAGGDRLGELFATAVTMPGPLDDLSPGTARMETQVLRLLDGTITAVGVVFAAADIANEYTIVGGTGRYAGARGSYSFDNNPNVARSLGRAAINFDVQV